MGDGICNTRFMFLSSAICFSLPLVRTQALLRIKVLILLCLAAVALADGYVSLTGHCYRQIFSFSCTNYNLKLWVYVYVEPLAF